MTETLRESYEETLVEEGGGTSDAVTLCLLCVWATPCDRESDVKLIIVGNQARIQGVGAGRARPPLGMSFTIQNALYISIQAPDHHWAPTPGRNPVSAPGNQLPDCYSVTNY